MIFSKQNKAINLSPLLNIANYKEKTALYVSKCNQLFLILLS